MEVLKQKQNSPIRTGCQVAIVYAVINGYLNEVAVKDVHDYEQQLFALLEDKHAEWLDRIEHNYFEDSDIQELKSLLEDLRR